jgi:hypothetical protein
MSIEYVKVFNQVMDEFFNELIETFPEESKIKVNYNLFQTLAKSNIRKPCSDFMFGSIPYLEKIAMRDEEFFTGNDKPSLLSSMNIEKLWTPDLSENTKNAIWKYIKTFFTIGVKVVQMPPETFGLIDFIINNNP